MTRSSVQGEDTRQGASDAPERAEAVEGAGGDDGESGAEPGRRRPRGRRRALRWTAVVFAVLLTGTAGAGYLYYEHLNDNIRKDPLNLGDAKVAAPTPNAAGQTPLNILVIGSDARDSAENQQLGGARETFGSTPLADVQMLVHLSADRSNLSVVSMPRDTLVKIPKCTSPDDGTVYPASEGRVMTNQSLGHGGPGCTVATWQELTGIHIDHFVMVDFAGVVSMADAVGGVPVCVDANIHSRDGQGHGSGLKLEKGTHPVQGEQALQWLRTRYGFEDGSDLARAKAQHMYLNSMVRVLRENATLSSPNKLRRLAEEATRALTVDPGLDTVKKLYDLSDELRKVKPERITMTTMPNRYVGARVEPTEDAEQLFRLVREDIALDGKDARKKEPAPATTPPADPAAPDDALAVQVRNGTRTDRLGTAPGRANTVAGLLVEQGFTQAVADPSVLPSEDRTVVRYPSADLEGDARRVAESLGVPVGSVQRSTDVSGVTLIVGADWREGTEYEAPVSDDRTPESAQALNGADESTCMHVDPAFTWS
ncbi:Cell envelope-associated transcriptional attenuator LytR-CpsA-Psr [Streptomyces ambofaciens ATCC 23877]|uniref:Cell envelope-associated transcriptional attenuator LytR-CpsA-Psr n=1 Tax=Streptomyces ambofaciens (strain ATCC 23877 / 3486 / DSM 40053 / JCM 4204 / NBRC 12836 / NRRL B-2516) TaxID=278992 RepID=A0A0K2ATJ2_STRA7|nr:LCP family protein [Streptomyces ambofaciens]AKZ56137.1 Cell envelope-associated transcriptional attenuator LytR-CpsA-Psr [Streptomyces ambofaciens ATCC 23877]